MPVRAKPGARVNAVLDRHGGALRIAVTAAPERGKANAAIVAVLTEALGCKPAQIALLSGATARVKRFLIVGLSPEELRARITEKLSRHGD